MWVCFVPEDINNLLLNKVTNSISNSYLFLNFEEIIPDLKAAAESKVFHTTIVDA